MTALVLDASIAASWLFDDEESAEADAAFDALATLTGIVPELWHYEMRNVLLVARRRQRITQQGLTERLAALVDLPLETDNTPGLGRAVELAETHTLSFYDALYLELAVRRGATLTSLDRRLVAAAQSEGLKTSIQPAE